MVSTVELLEAEALQPADHRLDVIGRAIDSKS